MLNNNLQYHIISKRPSHNVTQLVICRRGTLLYCLKTCRLIRECFIIVIITRNDMMRAHDFRVTNLHEYFRSFQVFSKRITKWFASKTHISTHFFFMNLFSDCRHIEKEQVFDVNTSFSRGPHISFLLSTKTSFLKKKFKNYEIEHIFQKNVENSQVFFFFTKPFRNNKNH